MIIGHPYTVAVYLEYISEYGYPRGIFNFIIEEQYYPAESTNVDLAAAVSLLKASLEKALAENMPETDSVSAADEDADLAEEQQENLNLLALDTGPLRDYGFFLCLGFDEDEDCLVYTQDYGKTWQEARFPADTVVNLIRNLPEVTDLLMEEDNGIFITMLKPEKIN